MSDAESRRKRPKPPQNPNLNKDGKEGYPKDHNDLPEEPPTEPT